MQSINMQSININYNFILNREFTALSIKNLLLQFEKNKHNFTFKRGIYIYGAPGSGKTTFVMNLLKELNYDIIKYDAGDIRNKTIIDTITKNKMSDKSVVSLLQRKSKPIAIIMDEIDGMNNGDKGGINSLIKIIRPKKTKKQKLEDLSYSPIICISSYHVDKKIKELMKVCTIFELKSPLPDQIEQILTISMPSLDQNVIKNMVEYLQGDLRKLSSINGIYQKHHSILKNEIIQNIFKPKAYNEDTKEITQKLFNNYYNMTDHINMMNDTDRTIVGLLWHENVIDIIGKTPKEQAIPLYVNILDKICFADYIDRITFQKQIWQFNEMSSLIKTFHCNKICHDNIQPAFQSAKPQDIRFTKVLTKYSTEYNNSLFIQELCQKLSLDKKDTYSFFLDLRLKHTDEEIYTLFEPYDITKLDINRIYRYLDKYTNKDCKVGGDEAINYGDVDADAYGDGLSGGGGLSGSGAYGGGAYGGGAYGGGAYGGGAYGGGAYGGGAYGGGAYGDNGSANSNNSIIQDY
jgi:DNA polymerase III delta prime subunit